MDPDPMVLGLPDSHPDPLVRASAVPAPDPSIIKKKIVRKTKTLISTLP